MFFYVNNHPVIEDGVLKSIDKSYVVVIPNNVNKILGVKTEKDIDNHRFGDDIFYNSLNFANCIRKVILPNKGVKIIGEKAFEHCHNLTSINLPEGIEEIRLSAFLCCKKLKDISLPHSIKRLDDFCFDLIDELIINYNGTKEEWNNIIKSDRWVMKNTLVNTLDGQIVI